MIEVKNNVFKLDTKDTSYIFAITEKGHAEHIHYGKRLPLEDAEVLRMKNNIVLGSLVEYDGSADGYSMETRLLEYSGIGKGDYRHAPMELLMPDGSYVTDFVYESYRITEEEVMAESGLPYAAGCTQTLSLVFRDKKFKAFTLILHYFVFEECNVIARCTELVNGSTTSEITVRKLMSFMMDLPDAEYTVLHLGGNWAKEAHIHECELPHGIFVSDSTTGASSNRHNPAFMLKAYGTNELHGNAYGFNLVYSGNHYAAVERSDQETVRVMNGIHPHCFSVRIRRGERFFTPQAVMSFSDKGTNALSENLHAFVNAHVIREKFRSVPRPVVLNNWEATFFQFNRRKILRLAEKAKSLGVEMFVLDDGWFGKRNDDTAGLGDWTVNEKKLPGGIASLSDEIHAMGLQFGLWFEPECVNEDSELYRAHPDWAIRVPEREPSRGRHQLVLDLTRKEVRDYIVGAVDAVLSSARIEYVKWDYNRHISDMYSPSLSDQGSFFHRYILGLYEVLRRIFCEKHPDVLLESCSSGGNRFDLGMLCFSAQIWTSDDTDARERMDIQRGIFTFYPPSTVSNHVSMTPNQQTLRTIPLSTRFHVACFGVLGYELDFGELTPDEQKQIKEQIEFYKENRMLLQYGRLFRYFPKRGERESWQITDGQKTVAAIFNLTYHASPARDILKIPLAEDGKRYEMKTVPSRLRIARFGSLIKHITPVPLRSDGAIMRTVDKRFSLTDGEERYVCSGEALQSGIPLAMQYSGTGYHESLRILGDFGSTMYTVTAIDDKEERK